MVFSHRFIVKHSFWKYFLGVKLAESTTFSTFSPPGTQGMKGPWALGLNHNTERQMNRQTVTNIESLHSWQDNEATKALFSFLSTESLKLTRLLQGHKSYSAQGSRQDRVFPWTIQGSLNGPQLTSLFEAWYTSYIFLVVLKTAEICIVYKKVSLFIRMVLVSYSTPNLYGTK